MRVAHAVFRPGLDHQDRLRVCRASEADMVEIDVLGPPFHDRLVVAHDETELRSGLAIGFDEALDLVLDAGDPPFALNVDLKAVGYEREVVEVLRERGLVERVLVSTTQPETLARMRAIAPDVRIGWSVPRLRRNPLESKLLMGPAFAALQVARRVLPLRAARAIRDGRCDALMANYHFVTRALVRAVEGAGGELYVWTVDDGDRIAALERMGVTGVITNDPRLFQPLMTQLAAE